MRVIIVRLSLSVLLIWFATFGESKVAMALLLLLMMLAHEVHASE